MMLHSSRFIGIGAALSEGRPPDSLSSFKFIRAVELLSTLRKAGQIPDFAIFGAVGTMAYLEPRTTKDLDIIILADTDLEYIEAYREIEKYAGSTHEFWFIIGGSIMKKTYSKQDSTGLPERVYRSLEKKHRQAKQLSLTQKLINAGILLRESEAILGKKRAEKWLERTDRSGLHMEWWRRVSRQLKVHESTHNS